MKLAIVGSGYVGLVTGACLADVGHEVTCVDNNAAKVERLSAGVVDIYEPSLERIVNENVSCKRLLFSTEIDLVINDVDAVFIAVGTPPDEQGRTNLQHVYAVAKAIGQAITQPITVVCKSTSPVGTCGEVKAIIEHELEQRSEDITFDVVSNPEFLKEGSAVADFVRPDRIVVGCDNDKALTVMREIYAPFNRNHDRIISMAVRSSELTKYAANAMLATKISFVNEMANIAERLGADIEDVRQGIGSDPRIGYDFLYAGCGYGGSCFPKDVISLVRAAEQFDYDAKLLHSVHEVNNRQKLVMLNRVKQHFGGAIRGKKIAVWGLSFKPNTNDIREAPSRDTLAALLSAGAEISAYDPAAMEEFAEAYSHYANLTMVDSKEQTLVDADALLVFTEWKEFKVIDFSVLRALMSATVVFDGRNLYDPQRMSQEGFSYFAIGRGDSVQQQQPMGAPVPEAETLPAQPAKVVA